QKAAKQTAAKNVQALNRSLMITTAVHLLFLLLRAFIFRSSFSKRSFLLYIFLSAPSLIIQFWFERIGRPTYGSEPGELLKSGEDLEAKGLTEWMWDVLYWTYGCLVMAAIFGDWVWWTWLVIPVYSGWAAYTTFNGARQGMAGFGAPAGEGDAPLSKSQQKLQKRGGQKVERRRA
ncbi:DUF788 domain protein, partial [Aulographum hederae CBS 113979]